MKNNLIDTRRSVLTDKDIKRFQSEITTEPAGRACPNKTLNELFATGDTAMRQDKYTMVSKQLNV